MIGRKHRKYRKLVGDLLYYRSELQFQEEIVKEGNINFNNHQRIYCNHNNIDLNRLREEHTKTISSLEEKYITRIQRKDAPSDARRALNKIYKSVVLSLHPDKLDQMGLSDDEFKEKEENFKKIASSMEEGDWGILLEASEELKIKPKLTKELFCELEREVNFLKKIIEKNETTYGWQFYNCGEEISCRDNLVKQFLKHVFNLEAI